MGAEIVRIDSIRQWAELVANVGVLIGIAFLIVELDQNTTSQRMQARLSLSERFNEQDGSIAEVPQLAELLVKADIRNDELTAAERRQYQAHYDRWMNILITADDMYNDGALTEVDWYEYVCEVRRHYVTSANFRAFFEDAKARYLTEHVYGAVARPELCGA